MRRLLVASLAIAAAAALPSDRTSAAGQAAQPAGAQDVPVFRAGTDLLTLDVSVLDTGGRPVEDLKPQDFAVKINGQTRRVTVARFVKADTAAGLDAKSTAGAGDRTARLDAPGRRILIAVDQQQIRPGSIKPLLNAASDFVDGMTARDLGAFVAFPEPGPHTAFTNDKAVLRKAMEGLVGQPASTDIGVYDIGLAEAITINDKERMYVNENTASAPDPPTVADILERIDCANVLPEEKLACRRRIVAESTQIAQIAKLDAKISIRTLESLIEQLASVDGNKSVVLISSSLIIDNQHDLDTLVSLATAARVSFYVIIVEITRENRNASRGGQNTRVRPPQENADRRLIAEGLEELAAEGRGSVYRLSGSGAGIFAQISREISASYVLGVESRPEDLLGKLDKVEVSVPRQRFKVRVGQAFARAPKAPLLTVRSLEDSLRSALTAPGAFTELPVQLATFAQWDPASDKVHVRLAAEVGQPGIQPGDYIVGYVVTDQDGRTVFDWSQKQSLGTPGARGSAQPFGDPLLLAPGVYSLRLGIVDSSRRQGTVIREVNVQRSTAGALATSDLLVGDPPGAGRPLGLSPEPRVATGRVAAYLELYSALPEDLDWTFVTFEIAKDASSPALAAEEADMVDGARPSWRVATGVIDARELAPGTYLARARAVRDGKTVGVVTRPFVLGPTAAQ